MRTDSQPPRTCCRSHYDLPRQKEALLTVVSPRHLRRTRLRLAGEAAAAAAPPAGAPWWAPPLGGRLLVLGPAAAQVAGPLAAAGAMAIACDLDRRGLMVPCGGAGSLSVVLAEPEFLPFPRESFELVVCRHTLHRSPEPAAVVWELARVCRGAGRIALEEPFCSEHEARARYHNRLARLRDRSHHRFLPLSALVGLLESFALRVRRLETEGRQREYNDWVRGAKTPPLRAQRLYQLLLATAEGDLAGIELRQEGETLLFTERLARILCERPS